MRTLLMTLLLVAPLLAQEAGEEKPAEQDKAKTIRKLVESLLASKDEQELHKLEGQLLRLLKGNDLTPIIGQEMRVVFGGTPEGGQETIAGSADGTSYTLKSLGGGRYKLTATQKPRDGEAKQIEDEGTLKDLRKKYAFLEGWFAVGVPTSARRFEAVVTHAGVVPVDAPRTLVLTAPRSRLGMLVRPPSESLSHHLELPTGAGLVVGSVTKGSRAEKLGLKEHDVLLRIDGELIDSPDQLKRLDENKGVLVYVRRAKPRTLDLSRLADDEK